jgi:hypothetical protein
MTHLCQDVVLINFNRTHTVHKGKKSCRMSLACTVATLSSIVSQSVPCSSIAVVSNLVCCTGSRTCPKGLNPAAAIAKIKLELAAD